MKFGIAAYAMNIQDGGDFSLEQRLSSLATAGCSGIERLEASDDADALQKAVLFRKHGMTFETCRGGSVPQHLRWTAAFGKKYIWLTPGNDSRNCTIDDFCRRSDIFIKACAEYGLDAALHNHLGARIQDSDELDYFMKKCPKAKLLFDVGHFRGAGGDVMKALEHYRDRLAGIHLKSIQWKNRNLPSDSNWRDRLDFRCVGFGNDDFDDMAPIAFLRDTGWNSMLLIEPDYLGKDIASEMKLSLEKIKSAGFEVDGLCHI